MLPRMKPFPKELHGQRKKKQLEILDGMSSVANSALSMSSSINLQRPAAIKICFACSQPKKRWNSFRRFPSQ